MRQNSYSQLGVILTFLSFSLLGCNEETPVEREEAKLKPSKLAFQSAQDKITAAGCVFQEFDSHGSLIKGIHRKYAKEIELDCGVILNDEQYSEVKDALVQYIQVIEDFPSGEHHEYDFSLEGRMEATKGLLSELPSQSILAKEFVELQEQLIKLKEENAGLKKDCQTQEDL